MNVKTYIEDIATIALGTKYNTSNNPICELVYGDGFTRVLFRVNLNKIREVYNEELNGEGELKHIIKFKNTSGTQKIIPKHIITTHGNSLKERTNVFKLDLVRISDSNWENGVGVDMSSDGFITNNYELSERGVTWNNKTTTERWVTPGILEGTEQIITSQIFTSGGEDIEFDITEDINNLIGSVDEYVSYVIKFSDEFEGKVEEIAQFVGFYTNKTITFFKPYMESTINDSVIRDDRNHFYLNKTNRLYFYSLIDGNHMNLDNLPTVSLTTDPYGDEEEDIISDIEVKNPFKGVYYVEITPNMIRDFEKNNMYYDKWSNISFSGFEMDDIILDFVVKPPNAYFDFNNDPHNDRKYLPHVYGINDGQVLNSGEIIKLFVNPRIEYSTKEIEYINNMEYRVYVKNGETEITVIDYDPIHMGVNGNFFWIRTMDLLPNEYFIDIKIVKGDEVKIHKKRFTFTIQN